MLSKLKNTKGVQELSKNAQKEINGKGGECTIIAKCAADYTWSVSKCDCVRIR